MGVMHNRAVALPTSLDIVRIHPRSRASGESAFPCLLPSIVVDIFDVEGMDVPRNIAEDRQDDVDE